MAPGEVFDARDFLTCLSPALSLEILGVSDSNFTASKSR